MAVCIGLKGQVLDSFAAFRMQPSIRALQALAGLLSLFDSTRCSPCCLTMA